MADYQVPELQGVPSGEVFVSYASQDVAVANTLIAALETHGIKCWIAPRDVRPGTVYADAIVGAINESKALVLVLSANAMPSAHVGREVERAASKRKQLIAFRIDAAPLSRELEYFLSNSQWIDVPKLGMPAAVATLMESVRRRPVAAPQILPVGTRAGGSKRNIAIVAVVVGVAVAIAIGMHFRPLNRSMAQSPPSAASAETPAKSRTGAAISDKSIAVLPFVDMSEKHDQEYFSDGLSEELIDHLAHNPDLKVIARTSSFAFKGKNEDMISIAAKLRVANLLEGSVRKAGGELRITAQLIRASDGVHLWSEIYDRKLVDIFKVQDEISTTVAKALNAALNVTPTASGQPASKGTTNLNAYNLVLQGTYFYWRGNKGDNAKAFESYQQALKLDPHYALAWAKLARVYAWQGYLGELPAAEAEVKGHDATQRALALDPNCAEAYFARGNLVRFISGDWQAAISDNEKAVALDPHGEMGSYAQGNIFLIKDLLSGRFELYGPWVLRNLDRNPLDTDQISELALNQQYAGQLEQSAVSFRKLLELNPAYNSAQALYGLTLLMQGKNVEALAAALKESDEASRLQALVCVYWAMGRRAESDEALSALERGFAARNGYMIAAAHAYRGEADAAFVWLDRAYKQRKGSLEDLKMDPLFRKLQGDPRFNAWLSKTKLSP
jgi:adenylate cyclase